MNEIKLGVTIPNSTTYQRIVLRKFFYMIFIDANGRKLYAYIASVFGGCTKNTDESKTAYKSIQYVLGRECSLKFDYQANDDFFTIASIENITGSFFNQTDKIKEVWGECTPLDSQDRVNNALKEFYKDLYENSYCSYNATPDDLLIKIKDKEDDRSCIVTKGEFNPLTSSKNAYILSVPVVPGPNDCYDGLEAMNWVKIEIDLKKNILEDKILFSISLEKDKIFTPDFTWYFAPPVGCVISSDSHVLVGEKATGQITINNVIQAVSDDTTVFFNEWSDRPESISERQKSRVLFKSSDFESIINHNLLSKKKTISVSLHLAIPQGPSNKQFVWGLFIAFLLAFCSDVTRLNNIYQCVQQGCTCVAGSCKCYTIFESITFAAPVLIILSFVSSVLDPEKALSRAEKGARKGVEIFLAICRLIGISITVLLVIYVFGLWLLIPEVLRSFKISCQTNNFILICGSAISFVLNMFYIFYCLVILKRKLYNFI